MVREYGILCWFIKWNEATKKLTDGIWVSSGRIVTCQRHGLIKKWRGLRNEESHAG